MILILALAPALVPAARAEPELRRAVALLDYVSGDYARAVGPEGQILSDAEHAEQIGFVRDAAREVRDASGATGADLATRLDRLAGQVERRAPPAQVSAEARALREEIVQRFHVALLPPHAPDLRRGAQVYAQSCAACHGAGGHPNAALQLETKPPDFTSAEEMKALTPVRAFNAETYGVPKTQMPAFDTGLTDQERWDAAFYLATLAHPQPAEQGRVLARAALVPTGYRELATLSDDDLRARLAGAGLSAADQEEAIAAVRHGPFTEAAPGAAQGIGAARREILRAVLQAKGGDRDGARRTLVSAYLDHFEPHEAALGARDGKLVRDIEGAFLAVRGEIDRGGPRLDETAAKLDALLGRGDAQGGSSGFVAFIAALAIALREGVEAALLVAAMLALLRKAGRARDASAVHVGWASALGLGALTWWASGALLVRLSGAHRELAEGVLQLITAALLLYASHWLLAAMSAKRLVSFLSAKTLSAGSAWVAFGLTFAAVYREMFEVVLFFRGLLLESPRAGGAVAGGALAGLLTLGVLVAAFQKLGRKLKPRPLLVTCGVLLCALAVLLVGNGVRSLQVLGVLPLTVWGSFQVPALGLYATREGLLAQAGVLVVLVGSALVTLLREPRQYGAAAAQKA